MNEGRHLPNCKRNSAALKAHNAAVQEISMTLTNVGVANTLEPRIALTDKSRLDITMHSAGPLNKKIGLDFTARNVHAYPAAQKDRYRPGVVGDDACKEKKKKYTQVYPVDYDFFTFALDVQGGWHADTKILCDIINHAALKMQLGPQTIWKDRVAHIFKKTFLFYTLQCRDRMVGRIADGEDQSQATTLINHIRY